MLHTKAAMLNVFNPSGPGCDMFIDINAGTVVTNSFVTVLWCCPRLNGCTGAPDVQEGHVWRLEACVREVQKRSRHHAPRPLTLAMAFRKVRTLPQAVSCEGKMQRPFSHLLQTTFLLFRSCYRERRSGCRKRKSVRGCIVGPDLAVMSMVIVKKGDGDIEGVDSASDL
eukprot:6486858-Amphidinium_carterae.1